MAQPTTPQSAPAEAPSTARIDLRNPVTISNVNNTFKYGPGTDIEVPTDIADELKRLDREHENYKATLLTKRVSETNAGSFAVGNGAE